VRFWDIERGKVRRVQRGHAHGVTALAYSPDGAILAAGDVEGVIRLWDIDQKK
jgi:WD40 repeat protein